MIVDFKNVTKIYDNDLFKKKFIALDDVSLVFPEAKTTALLGHNGAGKTTAIRCLLGLTRINSGKILFGGETLTTGAKAKIGYMPEINKLPMELTPHEILRINHGLYNKTTSISGREITAKLEEVAVATAAHKKIRELSKGMARRVAWAKACMHDPDLLVLDEPLSGLDPVARHDMVQWIKVYKQKGRSILFCTHELWSVRELCDEVHVFKAGKLAYTSLSGDHRLLTAHYHLSLSGVSKEQIIKLAEHMPSYRIETQGAYCVKMYFENYEDASRWLQKVLQHGLIVVAFSDELDTSDQFVNELLRREM